MSREQSIFIRERAHLLLQNLKEQGFDRASIATLAAGMLEQLSSSMKDGGDE